ncbi:Putative biotin ligase [uncultured archaeon]|nr:Putative biotin ligase [uncultured archaeon]
MASQEILGFLVSGEWVSGEEMATRLGVSRAAIWKQIRSLRKRGYGIESSTKRGYRLAKRPDILDAGLIRLGLKTKWLAKDLRCLSEVTSTNEVARSIARDAASGTVILAETQTRGKGRLSRSWTSPPGGIWMSLILKPKIPLAGAYQINMAVSVAVSKAIHGVTGLAAGIKWPNDLLIREKKICGILTEVSAEMDQLDYAIVGLGINVNVDLSGFSEEWRTTTLSNELGHDVSRSELISRILLEIEEALEMMGSRELHEEWRSRSVTVGKRVRISSASGEFVGEVMDLAVDGALLLQSGEEMKRVLAGDCIHLRPLEAA